MNTIFYYEKKLAGRLVVHQHFSNFFWHGANFRILNQHHRKRREPKFHGSLITGSRLILINPVTFGMTHVYAFPPAVRQKYCATPTVFQLSVIVVLY